MTSCAAPPTLLITTLAEYQTVFWAAVGHELRNQGHNPGFISFDDRSTELLRAQGFDTWDATEQERTPDVSDEAFAAALEKYGMDRVNYWFAHERVTFAIRDSGELRRKLLAWLAVADRACVDLLKRGRPVAMVQELGGFLSVIASFFAARRQGIDNWFIEPAFFRGRMFFLRNSFAAPTIPAALPDAASSAVRDYLEQTLASGAIVVPLKDRHQYTTAFRKIVNLKNARRLVQKLVDKHVHGKRQEFGYIGRYVTVHARMLLNSWRLRRHYTELSQLGRFVYYPLHVPGDMALTLRSPQFLDQLALIDYLARSLPHTHRIAIKEHPAMIGALDAGRILELLRRHDNLALLPPGTNNYEVLRAAEAVVSVNSKSGAEAALLGKPVLVLGDAFYRDSPLVTPVEKLTDVPGLMVDALGRQGKADQLVVDCYFEAVWRQCLPGELYVVAPANVRTFTESLVLATGGTD